MKALSPESRIAVIGAGMAGAALTRTLLDEGVSVHVFDKSHGPGGRMATRRIAWTDAQGKPRLTAFDHGAPCFSAKDEAFRAAVVQAVHAGWMTTWQPRLHPQGMPWSGGEQCSAHFVAAPDMPQWCRKLIDGAEPHWQQAVQALRRTPRGWVVECSDMLWPDVFDAVLLALPPAQASPLLAPHLREWAQRASLAVMQPCWTLMGVSDAVPECQRWDMARPEPGAIGLVLRNESRPGRAAPRDEMHWVIHAKAGWSRAHLDQEPAWIASAMQLALADWLGVELRWRHAVAHRWRYAMPQVGRHASSPTCWWDEGLRLGVCGDFLGGGNVEGAWRSADCLFQSIQGMTEPDRAENTAPVGAELGF
jgi:renalase